jgi:hypothetical protein
MKNMPNTWNYRVVDLEKDEAFVLCEVFYFKNKINSWAPISFRGPLGSSLYKWGTPAARKESTPRTQVRSQEDASCTQESHPQDLQAPEDSTTPLRNTMTHNETQHINAAQARAEADAESFAARISILEERHNSTINTAHKIFQNQQNQLDATNKRVDLLRDLLEKIYYMIKEDNDNGV